MNKILDKLKSLEPWQYIAIAAAVILGLFAMARKSSTPTTETTAASEAAASSTGAAISSLAEQVNKVQQSVIDSTKNQNESIDVIKTGFGLALESQSENMEKSINMINSSFTDIVKSQNDKFSKLVESQGTNLEKAINIIDSKIESVSKSNNENISASNKAMTDALAAAISLVNKNMIDSQAATNNIIATLSNNYSTLLDRLNSQPTPVYVPPTTVYIPPAPPVSTNRGGGSGTVVSSDGNSYPTNGLGLPMYGPDANGGLGGFDSGGRGTF